jgi:hypothetical protein
VRIASVPIPDPSIANTRMRTVASITRASVINRAAIVAVSVTAIGVAISITIAVPHRRGHHDPRGRTVVSVVRWHAGSNEAGQSKSIFFIITSLLHLFSLLKTEGAMMKIKLPHIYLVP